MSEHLSDHPHIPIVSDGVAQAVSNDLERDPDFKDRLFHDMNEEQHVLIAAVMTEANHQAEGDIAKKEAFIKGALYVLGALRRQGMAVQLEQLLKAEQASDIEILVVDPDDTAV